MTVRAVLANGRQVELDPQHGQTVADVHANLTADTLTGSAAPLAEAKLATVEGREVAYGDVVEWIEDSAF